MSICADIGRKTTEGTNECRITSKGDGYLFSIGVPGFNQSSHLKFLVAKYDTDFAKMDLSVNGESTIFEIAPKTPVKNLNFVFSPLEEGYARCKYSNKLKIGKVKVHHAAQIDTKKRIFSPSAEFKYKLGKSKIEGNVAAVFGMNGLIPGRCTSSLFIHNKGLTFGGRILGADSLNGMRFVMTGKADIGNVKLFSDYAPLENAFSAAAKVKVNKSLSTKIGVDNRDENLFAVCTAKYKLQNCTLRLSADTNKMAKVGIQYKNSKMLTTEFTASNNFKDEWPPKLGLFFSFKN